MINNRIIWHEGMFLQPHHFQQQDRFIENLIHQKQISQDKNYWGFNQLILDQDLIGIGKIGIKAASGIFPDGTYFDIPGVDHPPTPFDITEGLDNTTLYLAIPLRQGGIADAGAKEAEQTHRNKVFTANVIDSIADSYNASDIQLGTLAFKILSEYDDLSAYATLPITCIKESRSNQQISFEEAFETTWLDAHESRIIGSFVEETHGLIHHRAEMLASRLTDTKQAGTAEIVDFMLLQLLNRFEPLFYHLKNKRPLHPEYLYAIAVQLMGEMSTYTSKTRRPIEPQIYQHENLKQTYQPIIDEIKDMLSMVLEQNAVGIKLEFEKHGLWSGQIVDKTLIRECKFILSVFADMPSEQIKANFPSQVKIGPVEQINTLVSKALPGVPISPIAVAPRQIPYHANFDYFMIDTTHELWTLLEKSGGIAIHVGANIPNIKLELWAIKG